MPATIASGTTPHEKVSFFEDSATGLHAVIAIHSTALGPAAGGCRFWSYAHKSDAVADAMRLAEGMTYKNALAGLPFGGGKAVIMRPAGEIDRPALFKAFGNAVDSLGGAYVTAEDVGTQISDMQAVRTVTRHVAGLPSDGGSAGGDPSPWTALGVFLSMRHAVERRLGGRLAGKTVAVQGVGNVGMELCHLLHQDGANLVVADGSPSAQRGPRTFTARSSSLPRNFSRRTLTWWLLARWAPSLTSGRSPGSGPRWSAAAPTTNSRRPRTDASLTARGILYAPDYLVNAGGIINVVAEHMGEATAAVDERVRRIPERLAAVFDLAEASGEAPNFVADAMARTIVAGARDTARAAA